MSPRDRQASLVALLQRAGWHRDAAAAALSSAARDVASADATLKAIESARDRVLGAGRSPGGASLDPAALLRGVTKAVALDRLCTLATERHDEALRLAERRRAEGRAAQARVEALDRRRDDERRAIDAEAGRRSGAESDRLWLASLESHHANGPRRENDATPTDDRGDTLT